MKRHQLEQLVEQITKKAINEMPFGPQGYFPPVGVGSPRQPNKNTESIFLCNIATNIATKLKKAVDDGNAELKPFDVMIAPFVNYPVDTREGYLILGVVFTEKNSEKIDSSKKDSILQIERKYKKIIEKILTTSDTEIWKDYHKGISGQYKGVNWKTGIVISIVTPGKRFKEEFADKLKKILGL